MEGLALGEPDSAEGGRASFARGRLALPIRLVTSTLPRNDGDCTTDSRLMHIYSGYFTVILTVELDFNE